MKNPDVKNPSLETLNEIKVKALRVKPYLDGRDEKWTEKARTAYAELVERFSEECSDMVAPQQCEAAKRDFDYFMVLLALAEAYCKEDDENSEDDVLEGTWTDLH